MTGFIVNLFFIDDRFFGFGDCHFGFGDDYYLQVLLFFYCWILNTKYFNSSDAPEQREQMSVWKDKWFLSIFLSFTYSTIVYKLIITTLMLVESGWMGWMVQNWQYGMLNNYLKCFIFGYSVNVHFPKLVKIV